MYEPSYPNIVSLRKRSPGLAISVSSTPLHFGHENPRMSTLLSIEEGVPGIFAIVSSTSFAVFFHGVPLVEIGSPQLAQLMLPSINRNVSE
jgi:hypothetical protein